MLFSVEQAFVGREEIRAPLKTPAWEATLAPETTKVYTIEVQVSELGHFNLVKWDYVAVTQRKVGVFKRYSRWKELTSDTH